MQKFGLVVIGAHIGVHILPDINEYKNEQILLVEPVPHNLRILKKIMVKVSTSQAKKRRCLKNALIFNI